LLVIVSDMVVVVFVVDDIVPVVNEGTMFALAGKTYKQNSSKTLFITH